MKDVHAIRVLFIIILFWVSVAAIADQAIQTIEKKCKIPAWKIHVGIVVLLLFVIVLDPHTFERI
jgi:hypothetical protein